MKKYLILVLVFALFAFAACTGRDGNSETDGEANGTENVENGDEDGGVARGGESGRQFAVSYDMVDDNVMVATINGVPIYASEVWSQIPQMVEMTDWTQPDLAGEERTRHILEESVRFAAMFALIEDYAIRQDINLPEAIYQSIEEGMNEVEEMHAEYFPDGDFNAYLFEHGIRSRSHFRRYMYLFDLIETVIDEVIESPALFAEFEEFYEEEQEEVILAAQHILFRHDDYADEVEMEEAANAILDRIHAGEDFYELMHEYSTDPGLVDSPDGYTFPLNFMVVEFEATTRELEMGEVSGLVWTDHGIHIIRRVEPDMDNILRSPWEPQPPTPEERRANAIFMGFEDMLMSGDLDFLPELYEISVD